MRCTLTPCERWKLQRRGYVPMDTYNAQGTDNCCENPRNCLFGCDSNCLTENCTATTSDTDCCC